MDLFFVSFEGVLGEDDIGLHFFGFVEAGFTGGAEADLCFFGELFDEFDHVAAAFFGEFRDGDADGAIGGCGVEAEFGFTDGFFDVASGGGIEGLDVEHAWLRGVDDGEGFEFLDAAVCMDVDIEIIDERR